MVSIKQILGDAFHLFFPHNCLGCDSDLLSKTNLLCLQCVSRLPHTGYEKIANNPVENIFRGRVVLRAATSQFYFSKGQLVQQLIHQLKYKGNTEAGEWMGALMGRSLLQSSRFTNIDYIIPLPLYADKEFKRGFNQAEILCNGISQAMGIPVLTKNVIRQRNTDTQTKKQQAKCDKQKGSIFHQNKSTINYLLAVATVTRLTCIPGTSSKHCVQASKVAPVVITSSTSRIFFP